MELWAAGCVVVAIFLYPFVMGYVDYRRQELMIHHYNMMMMRARHDAEDYEMQQQQLQRERELRDAYIAYTTPNQHEVWIDDDDVELYYADDDDDEYR